MYRILFSSLREIGLVCPARSAFRVSLLVLLLGAGTLQALQAQVVTVCIEDYQYLMGGEVTPADSPYVSIYPNPATIEVTVAPNFAANPTQLDIYQATGSPVLSEAITGTDCYEVILSPGLYLFKVTFASSAAVTETVRILAAP